MNKKLHKYLMSLPDVTLDYPFGSDIHVYRIKEKIFAIYFKSDSKEHINLKCNPVLAQELRSVFTEITPGYHMNKKHWNTIDLRGKFPRSELHRLIDHSYDLIVSKLPKDAKQRLRILYERFSELQ